MINRLENSEEKLARDLDWNLLRTFMVIVQEGGITAAANTLFLRQPTISQALKRLEERLDKQLIERSPSTFRVTPAGEHLYRECVEIYGSIKRATSQASALQDELTGRVHIAMNSQVVCDFFDERLAEFHRRHPKVTFELAVQPSAQVISAVLDKSASLGIGLVHTKNPKLDYSVIYRQHFGFYCGPQHPLFGREDLTLEDLRGQASVAFQTDQLTDALNKITIFRAQHGLNDCIVGVSSNLIEVKRMIVMGLGIAPLPNHIVEQDVLQGKLWRLPPYDDSLDVDVFLSWHPSARLNRAEHCFLKSLREAIDERSIAKRSYGKYSN